VSAIQETAARLAKEVSPDLGLKADGWLFDEIEELLPSTDWKRGVLYMTFPIEREVTKTIGRGQKAKDVTVREAHTLCIGSDRSHFSYEPETVGKMGFKFPPIFTQGRISRWPLPKLRKYILEGPEPVEPADLFKKLRAVYYEHVEYADDIYYDLVPLFLMASYVFRIFKQMGYLHFNGTQSTGKSVNLQIIQALGLNPIWASLMSPAALFRQVAGDPGIICIDEAESFDSERGQELRTILLSGYKDGSTVPRAEKGTNDTFQIVHYASYSPKALASINPLEPVLQSRCLVIPMAPAIRGIKTFDRDSPNWPILRNQLYHWAMQNAATIADIYHSWHTERRYTEAADIQHRAWEVANLYVVLAEHVGGAAMVTSVLDFMRSYFKEQQKSLEETDRLRLLLKCLPRMLAETMAIDGEWYQIKDIHAKVLEYLEEDARQFYTSKRVGLHMTSLGFRERRSIKGGTAVKLTEDQVRTQFLRRRVEPFEEDQAWMKGDQSYRNTLAIPTPAKRNTAAVWGVTNQADPFSWLDDVTDESNPVAD
jgi:hypothetical protein